MTSVKESRMDKTACFSVSAHMCVCVTEKRKRDRGDPQGDSFVGDSFVVDYRKSKLT